MFVIAIIIIIISECALRRFFIRENELFPRSLSVGRGEPSKQTELRAEVKRKEIILARAYLAWLELGVIMINKDNSHGKLRCTLDLMPAADPHDPDIRG